MPRADDNASRLAAHERLVQALLHDPAALVEPPARRTLVQTHISSLVLAGDQVFKLRKPLRLDFLDFSTAALRRRDCDDELRLNRRTAPQLYLDVQAITGSTEHPRIGGPAHEAIDWALRMRRFDDGQRLDRLAEQGRLTAADVDTLAASVAGFHGALPPSPATYGRPEDVRHWAMQNFDALLAGPAAAGHAVRLLALRAWTDSESARLAPLLAERRAAGFVRECHGDLHLGNIVRVDGQALPFDCLEFNAALRHIDVMADLAFLFMDLHRHGLPRLAWRLVNAYTEGSGDHAGLALLRYFAVYRAMVRAKVAMLRAVQHDSDAWAAFGRDLGLAEALAAAHHAPPRLVLASGLSGSGKSTLAGLLVEALGAVRIRSDVERKRLFGLPPGARSDVEQRARLYAADATRRTYERLSDLAAELLDAGVTVVVDAALLRRGERDALRAVAQRHGSRFDLLECQAPPAVLRRRLGQRASAGTDASDADEAVLQLQLGFREPVGDDEGACRVDTDCAPPELERRALRCLRADPLPQGPTEQAGAA